MFLRPYGGVGTLINIIIIITLVGVDVVDLENLVDFGKFNRLFFGHYLLNIVEKIVITILPLLKLRFLFILQNQIVKMGILDGLLGTHIYNGHFTLKF